MDTITTTAPSTDGLATASKFAGLAPNDVASANWSTVNVMPAESTAGEDASAAPAAEAPVEKPKEKPADSKPAGGEDMQDYSRYPRYGDEYAEEPKHEPTKWEACYDKEANLYCRRTPTRCCILIGYYLTLYCALAGFFMLLFYLHTVVYPVGDKPRYSYHREGKHPYLNSPGLTTIPQGGIFLTNIDFKSNEPKSYEKYVKDLDDYLNKYDFKAYRPLLCDTEEQKANACPLSAREQLGECSGLDDASYGYDTGEPCVLFRLTRIIGWEPKPYDTNPDTSKISSDRFDKDFVQIGCEVIKPKTCDNCLGDLQFFPLNSFSVSCYPYCGYNSSAHDEGPIQMIKFKNVRKNKELLIWCEAFAENIERAQISQQGGKIFELDVKE